MRPVFYAFLCALVVAVAITSCTKDPMRTEKTANEEFKVDFLFENDGCKVYRFYDGGYHRYYTNCSATSSTYSCGKGCTQNDDISTGYSN